MNITPADLRALLAKSPNAWVDVPLVGEITGTVRLARKLKARAHRVEQDPAGTVRTWVRIRRNVAERWCQTEENVNAMGWKLQRAQYRKEVAHLDGLLAKAKAHGTPIAAVVIPVDARPGPAMIEVQKAHGFRVIHSEFTKDMLWYTEEELTAQRAKMLEMHGRPLETSTKEGTP